MANHASAERRNRQRIKRTARNRSIKSAVRTALKKARQTLSSGKLEEATAAVAVSESTLDRAASKGTIHPRTAARKKARLARQLSQAKRAATAG